MKMLWSTRSYRQEPYASLYNLPFGAFVSDPIVTGENVNYDIEGGFSLPVPVFQGNLFGGFLWEGVCDTT